jgi:hypothetical protein
MEESGQHHVAAVLPMGKDPRNHLSMGGNQNSYERFEKEKNLFPVPEFEPRTVHPAV